MFDGVSASAAENMRQPSASEKQSSRDDGAFAALVGEARRDESRAERLRSKDDTKPASPKSSSTSSGETDPTPNHTEGHAPPADETSAPATTGLVQLAHIQTQFASKTLQGSKSAPLQTTQPTGQTQQSATPAITGDQADGVDAELSNTFKKVLNSGTAANQNTTSQKIAFSDALSALRGDMPQKGDGLVQSSSHQSGTGQTTQSTASSTTGGQVSAGSNQSGAASVASADVKVIQPTPSQTAQAQPGADTLIDLSGDAANADAAETSEIQSSSRTTSTAEASRAQAPVAMRQATPTVFQTWSNIMHRFDGKAQRFEIRLDPAELGKIDVKIEITQENKAQIVLAARSAEALAELNRGARSLEVALSESGVELTENGLSFELAQDDTPQDADENDDLNFAQNSVEDADDENSDEISQKPAETGEELTVWTRLRVNVRA